MMKHFFPLEGLNPFKTQLDRCCIEEKRFLGFQPTHHPSWGITGMTVTVGKGTTQLTISTDPGSILRRKEHLLPPFRRSIPADGERRPRWGTHLTRVRCETAARVWLPNKIDLLL
ncbi:hypothetical protein CEXT_630881 [Caerostris extrusa]|uniref:Uncharacterized protein n=1 Tax=Caerostris extrusa TaxID=172846 RepID=A0AAV4QB57_CAEEX|nr:hypothetical protein CEXT_630881 [Caerostris extrusa]